MILQYIFIFKIGSQFYNMTDRGPFGDALEEMDDSIGELMDFIGKSGIMENTLVIFTSDNGLEILFSFHCRTLH